MASIFRTGPCLPDARRDWLRSALRLSLGAGTLLGASAGTLMLSGCAALAPADPPRVNLVGITALPGEGLELRFLVRLRVQNPSETSLDYDGISLELELRDMSFASGVSSERGTVPRFGEAVIAVPVTVSATALLRQGLSLLQDQSRITSIPYRLRGRLGGFSLGSRSFDARGQVDWPPVPSTSAAAPGSV
jgi:LEA14-like dessication related protein